ncbi:hypothetical protein Y032_0026g1474 [Ancylostoma ceylanicum]|uniref:Uncharacterized protein n=1 Tax=Ancylostoma ceylanicum TaxID=53326 RepID=A0A016UVF1_9BILA|nr:hypothetical protein Y032_0026g1474 [Ancylostoma ceylanicum]
MAFSALVGQGGSGSWNFPTACPKRTGSWNSPHCLTKEGLYPNVHATASPRRIRSLAFSPLPGQGGPVHWRFHQGGPYHSVSTTA